MPTYAGTQQSVTLTMSRGMKGDLYGNQKQYSPTQGFLAGADGVVIGNYCWGISTGTTTTNTVTNVKGTNTLDAGFVVRSQSTPMPNSAATFGYSMNIDAGYHVTIISQGSLINEVLIAAGHTLALGDLIYVSKLTGQAGVGFGADTDYVATDFKLVKLMPTVPLVNSLATACVISNVETFMGN
jgi:hypothetical protein